MTTKRDEMAEQYGLAVNKNWQERMPTSYLTGGPRPWLDKPDRKTTNAYKAGWDAALRHSDEVKKLIEVLEFYADKSNWPYASLGERPTEKAEQALALWKESLK